MPIPQLSTATHGLTTTRDGIATGLSGDTRCGPKIYNERYISVPLLSVLSRLQDQLKATGNTEAAFAFAFAFASLRCHRNLASPATTPSNSTLHVTPARDTGFRVASKTYCRTSISPSARSPKPTAAITYNASTLTGPGQSSPGKAVLGAGRVGAKGQANFWWLSAGNNNWTRLKCHYTRGDKMSLDTHRCVS